MSFPTTQWTLIAAASVSGDSTARTALARMCENYRGPVLAFLRSRGHPEHDAQDFAQEFFSELIVSQAWKRAERERGRFRTFLLGVLLHVVGRGRERAGAEKRGRGQILLSLEELEQAHAPLLATPADDVTAFDREWALRLMERALVTVGEAQAQAGHWPVLQKFLPGAGATPTYEEAAAHLAISMPALKTAVHRVRQDFRAELRAAVARTVSAAHEIDDELAYLHRVLTSHGR